MEIEDTVITEISKQDAYYDCSKHIVGKKISTMDIHLVDDGWYGGIATFAEIVERFGSRSLLLYHVRLKMTLWQRIKLFLWSILWTK